MGEFKMPSLGADMEDGTLVAWKVKPGEAVKRGDIVASVETQKGVIEVEVFDDEIFDRLIVPPGQKVPVGAVLALVHHPGEAPAKLPEAPPPPSAAAAAPEVPPPYVEKPVPAPAPPAHRPRISPAARKRAEVLGVDLQSVEGTGPQGAVTARDVEEAAERKPSAPSPMRAAIAAAMSRSKREIPHYYLSTRLEMSRPLSWLERANRERPVTERMLPVILLLKAVARAVKHVPEVNGFFVDGRFRPMAAVHLGVAIALRGGGLIAPAIHDVQDKPLDALMRELSDLILRTRSGSIRGSELSDPTLTVTSLAEPGVEAVYGIIHPPQVAILGFGRAVPTPVALDEDTLGIRPVITATLSGDHRVSDGHDGGRFLAEVDRLLQTPEAL